jgi:hypothetical protein
MTGVFDPELVELTIAYGHGEVEVYKIGGGTLGRSYGGLWGYRLTHGPSAEVVASGEDLRTGAPKTHDQAARIVLDIFDQQEQ